MKGKTSTSSSLLMQEKIGKNQHPLIVKILNKLGIEGNYLNIIKVTYEKPTLYIIIVKK